MTLSQTVLLAGAVSCLLPVAAAFLRRQSRLHLTATMLLAFGLGGFLLILLRLTSLGPAPQASRWAYGLVAWGVPLLLAGHFFSAVLGRDHPVEAFRRTRRVFLLMGLGGLAFLVTLRHPLFVSGYEWVSGRSWIAIGPLGKAYLSYLLIGIVFTGYNLESAYRTASPALRLRLRMPFLGSFALLGFLTYVLTVSLLYASLEITKLVACSGPVLLANVLLAYGFLRGALVDRSTPVSRNIVYSSFTALAAGLYVFAVGAVAQLSTFTHWSPDEVVSLSLAFLVVLMAVLLLVSNRFQRLVRRFIDRNFYVNRYDYRAQWVRVTHTLEQTEGREDVLREARSLLTDIFLADKITISLLDRATGEIRPVLGKGLDDPDSVLKEGEALHQFLIRTRRSMLVSRRPDDFEYLPVHAENRAWLDATASQLVAPLLDGEDLVGVVGLERRHEDDPYTFEDALLLDSVAAHVSSALRSARLLEELSDSREIELLSQWSSMLLHDLKNYLTPLRMVAENLHTRRDKPGIAETASTDLGRIADRMESLVRTLSDLREDPALSQGTVDLDALARETAAGLNLDARGTLRVVHERRTPLRVAGDCELLKRVLENLINNAIQAMEGSGTITLRSTVVSEHTRSPVLQFSVIDDGPGMTEEFVRERLFRPFATTKKRGLGLGLYQCRSIVRAHGGTLRVQSRPGQGTAFHLLLKAVSPGKPPEAAPSLATAAQEG